VLRKGIGIQEGLEFQFREKLEFGGCAFDYAHGESKIGELRLKTV
jgi:hypothetical protein